MIGRIGGLALGGAMLGLTGCVTATKMVLQPEMDPVPPIEFTEDGNNAKFTIPTELCFGGGGQLKKVAMWGASWGDDFLYLAALSPLAGRAQQVSAADVEGRSAILVQGGVTTLIFLVVSLVDGALATWAKPLEGVPKHARFLYRGRSAMAAEVTLTREWWTDKVSGALRLRSDLLDQPLTLQLVNRDGSIRYAQDVDFKRAEWSGTIPPEGAR